MPTWLSPELLGALTPAILCCLFVLLFMLGWIRPKRAVDEVRQDRDARLAERDVQIAYLHQAIIKAEDTNKTQAAALQDALEVSEAVVEILTSIRNMAAERHFRGPTDSGGP